MKNLFLITLLFCTFFSCKNDTAPKNETPKKEEAPRPAPEQSCFLSEGDGPQTAVMLIARGEDVQGTITQSSGISGAFEGRILGGVVFADVSYQKEGKLRTEEIALRLGGEELYMGRGEQKYEADRYFFADRGRLDFGILMRIVDCNEIDELTRNAKENTEQIELEKEKQGKK